MSESLQTYLEAGLAKGYSLDAIIAVAREYKRAGVGQPSTVPQGLAEDSETSAASERELVGPERAVTLPGAQPLPATTPLVDGLPRYDDLGPLGVGGTGEVRRVRDRRLGRTLALKIIHAMALNRPALVARFREEAQATAQLQHPGIVPIYDLGTLPDGRLWFTMKEVSGQTFGEVIAEVHAVSRRRWQRTRSGWSLRRLVDTLRAVCETITYAHTRGVIHRDLKPANVMVGAHGEVLVLDWGLAKVLGHPDLAAGDGEQDPVQTVRSAASVHQTQVGMVMGTPAYMPPEQALGAGFQVDARSDVYALGAILYTVLSGRAPYTGSSALDVLDQVRARPPAALRGASTPLDSLDSAPTRGKTLPQGPPLPPSLVVVCERAMARDPADRISSAGELAAELLAWLEGDKRHEEARAVVARAADKAPLAAALRSQAATLRSEAAALLEDVEDWQPEEDKLPGWAKEDAAAALDKQAEQAELEEESLLRGSLTHAPDLPDAHAALAARYRAEHEAAEATRQDPTRAETRFRQHLAALPDDHTDRAGHLAYLKGDGALTLLTDPPGAEVLLHRYVPYRRRLVLQFERSLGTTPLRSVLLPMGSYLCIIQHPQCAEVRYPVSISRGEHWHGVPPEGGDPLPIPLPRSGELGPDDRYVPAGWFACGGDPELERSLAARRIWVDGQIVRRFPVTTGAYLTFLDALVAQGRTEEALRHAPRERGGTTGGQGALINGFDGKHFSLRPDADGDIWERDWPVCMVDWFGARAFAAWEAERTGQPWRLPGELAWEKTARGVDGRYFPWGDGFDPSWASMRRSHRGRMLPTAVGAYPVDESPYGVRDLAGSLMDWCSDPFLETGPPAASARQAWAAVPSGAPSSVLSGSGWSDPATSTEGAFLVVNRGGSWNFTQKLLRSSYRYGVKPYARLFSLGFRLARPYPWPSEPCAFDSRTEPRPAR